MVLRGNIFLPFTDWVVDGYLPGQLGIPFADGDRIRKNAKITERRRHKVMARYAELTIPMGGKFRFCA